MNDSSGHSFLKCLAGLGNITYIKRILSTVFGCYTEMSLAMTGEWMRLHEMLILTDLLQAEIAKPLLASSIASGSSSY